METIEKSVAGGRVMNKQSTEEFYGSENALCDPRLMDMCHYTFAQTPRMSNSKSEPYSKPSSRGGINVNVGSSLVTAAPSEG